jgi:ArsR family metal-binding transcriptional regulator
MKGGGIPIQNKSPLNRILILFPHPFPQCNSEQSVNTCVDRLHELIIAKIREGTVGIKNVLKNKEHAIKIYGNTPAQKQNKIGGI